MAASCETAEITENDSKTDQMVSHTGRHFPRGAEDDRVCVYDNLHRGIPESPAQHSTGGLTLRMEVGHVDTYAKCGGQFRFNGECIAIELGVLTPFAPRDDLVGRWSNRMSAHCSTRRPSPQK